MKAVAVAVVVGRYPLIPDFAGQVSVNPCSIRGGSSSDTLGEGWGEGGVKAVAGPLPGRCWAVAVGRYPLIPDFARWAGVS